MRTGSWTFRRAEQADCAALTACIDAAYAEHAERISDLPAVSEDMSGEIARHQVWVAVIAGTVAGGLVLVPEDGLMRLANVAVDPGYQGIGLGRALIAHAEEQAREQGFAEMRLTTHALMSANIGLYRRLGWQEVERRGNAVVMRRPIGDR